MKYNDLKTGMIIKVRSKRIGHEHEALAMVLLDTKFGNIFVGETWGELHEKCFPKIYPNYTREIIEVWQPKTNMAFLQTDVTMHNDEVGLNTNNCHLIWRKEDPVLVHWGNKFYNVHGAVFNAITDLLEQNNVGEDE